MWRSKSAPKVPINPDEAFLAEYKRNVMQYAEVRNNLLAVATRNHNRSRPQSSLF